MIFGVLVCYFLFPLIERWLEYVVKNNELPPPNGIEKEDWLKLVCPGRLKKKEEWSLKKIMLPTTEGAWLGILERILSFIAFYEEAPVVIAGWLAFKVASKWQVWTNVIKLPKELGEAKEDDLSFVRARRYWAQMLLMRFLIGTLSNVLIGMAIAFVMSGGSGNNCPG